MAIQRPAAVDLAAAFSEFEPLVKEGGVYVARLARPLVVQTPPLTVAAPLGGDDEPTTHAHLGLPPGFADFAARVEAAALEACLAHKADWFRRPLEDDALRASFKRFLDPATSILKVRLPRSAPVFDAQGELVDRDAVPTGSGARCLLELSKLSFGRTEFGGMWSLVQAQQVQAPPAPPAPVCLIDASDDDDADPEEGAAAEDDAPDFL